MKTEQTLRGLKGNIVYSKVQDVLEICENGFLIYGGNKIIGVYKELPEKYKDIPIEDYEERLIIPGLMDLHVHAPQYAFRGLGMDMELLDWLNTNTFPEESKYRDLEYAEKAYKIFVENLRQGATTRACIFATIHRQSTLLLMDLLEEAGLSVMVGKVNMDRNSPEYLIETTEESVDETIRWLNDVLERNYKRTKPILTHRFIPSCTDELMK